MLAQTSAITLFVLLMSKLPRSLLSVLHYFRCLLLCGKGYERNSEQTAWDTEIILQLKKKIKIYLLSRTKIFCYFHFTTLVSFKINFDSFHYTSKAVKRSEAAIKLQNRIVWFLLFSSTGVLSGAYARSFKQDVFVSLHQ